MQRFLITFTGLLFFLGSCKMPPESVLILESYKYFLRLPDNYDPQQKYPLILFLHGGGCGTAYIAEFDSYGLGAYANQTEDFPFIIVAPQTSDDWYANLLDHTLDEIVEHYSVDTDHIYVTGFSMGAKGTYRMAFEYPTRFAAIAPVAGYGETAEAYKIKLLPVWIFHDIGDTLVPYSYAEEMYDSLMAHGGDVRLTTYYNNNHNCWNETYANPELYDWFLSHQKQ